MPWYTQEGYNRAQIEELEKKERKQLRRAVKRLLKWMYVAKQHTGGLKNSTNTSVLCTPTLEKDILYAQRILKGEVK